MNKADKGALPERLIVYIDGFNLYHGMHDTFGRSTLWLDLVALAQSFRPAQRLVKVKYFTAPVVDEPDAQARQAIYLQALTRLYPDTFEVHWGRYQARKSSCRNCGYSFTRYEEKETDVSIAVELVSDAAANFMETAFIVSADSDLAPAVKAAQKLNSQLFIAAAFPPRRFSSSLKALMPASFPIGERKLRANQLPELIEIESHVHERPEKWV